MPEREWRCSRCNTLLGIEQQGAIHLKYKKARFIVRGSVVAQCRKCAQMNETSTSVRPARKTPRFSSDRSEAALAQ